MDYLPDEGTLLIGTNSGFILSDKLDERIINFNDFDGMLEMGDMSDFDQNVEDEYDPLDGKTID